MARHAYERTFRPSGAIAKARDAVQVRHRAGVTREQVEDPAALALLLTRLIEDVKVLSGGRKPRIDFEDYVCTSGTNVVLEHRFGCRVRWWLVDWIGSAAPNLRKDTTNTTANMLVLTCGQSGTGTFRVEAC